MITMATSRSIHVIIDYMAPTTYPRLHKYPRFHKVVDESWRGGGCHFGYSVVRR